MKIACRVERLHTLGNSLKAFQRHYQVPLKTLETLRARLTQVPQDMAMIEMRLIAGLPAHPSELPVQGFKENVISAMKDIGLWERTSPKDRDVLRKRLSRKGKLAITHGKVAERRKGRPGYRYSELEKTYATAIARALNGTFPISRTNGKLHGPAFELLEAALCHALPYSGNNGNEGRAMRLRAIFRHSSDN